MKSKAEILKILTNSNGTENYHKYSYFGGYPVATDGVIALAEAAGCYWLLDIIGSYQGNSELAPNFQVWTLEVDIERSSAVVSGCNDDKLIVTQKVSFTDFPLSKVELYVINGVILLPSEY